MRLVSANILFDAYRLYVAKFDPHALYLPENQVVARVFIDVKIINHIKIIALYVVARIIRETAILHDAPHDLSLKFKCKAISENTLEKIIHRSPAGHKRDRAKSGVLRG